jgi:hypothetical protein
MLSSAHVVTTEAKPMSLPPIPIVTTAVPEVSALNCGGLVPSVTDCDCVMFAVVAPEQLMSWKDDGPIAARTRDG